MNSPPLLKIDIGECPNYAGIIATGCQELVRLSVEPARVPVPNTGAKPLEARPAVEGTVVYGASQTHHSPLSSRKGSDEPTTPDFHLSWLDAVPAGGGRLNGYNIESLIGRGGMGVVLKAYDPGLDRHVAIKMLRPEGMVRSEGRERFVHEARAVAAIQHESVVTIYAVAEFNCVPYLVMEYVPGMSLQDEVDRQGRPAVADVVRYGRADSRRAEERRPSPLDHSPRHQYRPTS